MHLKSNTVLMILATALSLLLPQPTQAQTAPSSTTPSSTTPLTLPDEQFPTLPPNDLTTLINTDTEIAPYPKPNPLEPTPKQIKLLTQLQSLLDQNTSATTATTQTEALSKITTTALKLEALSPPAPLHLRAISVRMQALYLHATRFPSDPLASTRLARLKIAARQTKSIDEPTAPSLGDFWLLMVEIHDINQSQLTLKERTDQTRLLLEDYQSDYPNAPTHAAIQKAIHKTTATTPNIPSAVPTSPTAPSPNTPIEPTLETTPSVIPNPTPATEDITPEVPQAPLAIDGPPIFTLTELQTENNITHYTLASRFQAEPNSLRVLLPDNHPAPGPRRILFLLPVEAADGHAFGDSLTTFQQLNLHNTHNLIVVAPTFNQTPWYADHPTDVTRMQESYFTRAVIPAVNQLFPAQKPKRLLLGFSKSGWGALSMQLRHPKLFDAAASWDAPLMLDAPDKFDMNHIITSPLQFERYNLARQFREKARFLRQSLRIAILGHDYFQEDLHRAHSLLQQLNIPHLYTDGPQRDHRWNSGWLTEATEALDLMTKD